MFDNRTVTLAINREILPMLKEAGFRSQDSRSFLRETERTIVVLELLSCGSLRDHQNPSTAITAWYGIFFKEIGRHDEHRYPMQKLLASSCQTRAIPLKRGMRPRLWHPQAENIWLTQDEYALKQCMPDLIRSIREQILDRLEEYDSFDFMVRTLDGWRDCLLSRYYRAVFHKLYGTPEQYRESLRLYLEEVERLDEFSRKNKSEPLGPNPRALA